MTEEKLTQYLDEIMGWLRNAGEFASAQAPEVVDQFLAYHFWTSLIGTILAPILLAIIAFAVFRWLPWTIEEDCPEVGIPILSVGIIGLVGLPIWLVVSIYTLMKVTIAPKLYVLEHLTSIIN